MKKLISLICLSIICSQAYSKGSSFSSARSSRSSSSFKSSSSSSFKISTSKVESKTPTIKFGSDSSNPTKASSFSTVKSAKDYKSVYIDYKKSFEKPKFSYEDLRKYQSVPKTSRRKTFYDNYTPRYYSSNYNVPPQMHISQSYGAWDGFLMWSLLDNIGDSMMYYHHMNDPAFQQWRSEANQLAQTDPEVKKKLAELDAKVKDMEKEGIPKDNGYITPGIDPDIYEAEVDKTKLPKINFCAGSISGDYYSIAFLINQKTKMNIETIQSNGSEDNISKIEAGKCDIGVTQDDVFAKYSSSNITNIGDIKAEYAILACNAKSNIKTTDDLSKNSIYVGKDETGSIFTLNTLKSNITKLGDTNIIRSQSFLEAIESAKNDKTGCAFTVTNYDIKLVKDKMLKGETLRLVSLKVKVKELPGQYAESGILLSKFQSGFWTWIFNSKANTIQTGTSLIVNNDWKEKNRNLYDILLLEMDNIRGMIND